MKEFKGKLGNYKILDTEDNTQTVYSDYFNEACHNLSGAYQETIHNYIQGCSIPEYFSREKTFSVLDVGFGVGVGLKALIDQRLAYPTELKDNIFYYSIELDEELFLWSVKTTLPNIEFHRCHLEDLIWYEADYRQMKLKIFIGDGRFTLPSAWSQGLMRPVDAIFQDAFSPKKNPTLWSVEWFSFLKSISAPTVKLATYSSSISIRKSLLAAGWAVINDRGFALKRTMTKANLIDQTSPEILQQLERSPSKAIYDSDIS